MFDVRWSMGNVTGHGPRRSNDLALIDAGCRQTYSQTHTHARARPGQLAIHTLRTVAGGAHRGQQPAASSQQGRPPPPKTHLAHYARNDENQRKCHPIVTIPARAEPSCINPQCSPFLPFSPPLLPRGTPLPSLSLQRFGFANVHCPAAFNCTDQGGQSREAKGMTPSLTPNVHGSALSLRAGIGKQGTPPSARHPIRRIYRCKLRSYRGTECSSATCGLWKGRSLLTSCRRSG